MYSEKHGIIQLQIKSKRLLSIKIPLIRHVTSESLLLTAAMLLGDVVQRKVWGPSECQKMKLRDDKMVNQVGNVKQDKLVSSRWNEMMTFKIKDCALLTFIPHNPLYEYFCIHTRAVSVHQTAHWVITRAHVLGTSVIRGRQLQQTVVREDSSVSYGLWVWVGWCWWCLPSIDRTGHTLHTPSGADIESFKAEVH